MATATRSYFLAPRQVFLVFAALCPSSLFGVGLVFPAAWWLLIPVVPLTAIGLHDCFQSKHAILRSYPLLGHGRFLAERIRPEIQQYFVETNNNGMPFSRETREIVYSRSKGQQDKLPFGTQVDVYEAGHEFLAHSLYPKTNSSQDVRVRIGGSSCSRPYNASLLNISAMSFGALSEAAILALSRGAAKGGFAHNTGEGGVSPHHLAGGADLIWQIGTGYFGCRTPDGRFDPDMFRTQASNPAVKMIEIKLSQGAKPAHGGILPASKLTDEIASIRKVELGHDVISPPSHSVFDSPDGLLLFVAKLRDLSDGKPVGFKLCIGDRSEVLDLVAAMSAIRIFPDFIVVDGAEGGTGAAPPELSDSVGLPLREGLDLMHKALTEAGVRSEISVIAAGKVATGFDMARCFALGADLCYSARAMMLSLGCIQARRCHTNECPVGVATQDKSRSKALVVSDKAKRVEHFHRETVRNFLELVGAAGCDHPSQLSLQHIHRRIDQATVATYEEIYGSSAYPSPSSNPPAEPTTTPIRSTAEPFAPLV